jgi:hypothetical protein
VTGDPGEPRRHDGGAGGLERLCLLPDLRVRGEFLEDDLADPRMPPHLLLLEPGGDHVGVVPHQGP